MPYSSVLAHTNKNAWSKGSWTVLLLLLAAYVTLVGHRPIATAPGAIEDDQLFIRLALDLASGQWLGAYNHLTLVKGIGFPAFLCLNYCLGLPVNLSLCTCYGLACAYLASVLKPLLRSQIAALVLFALLLFLPPLATPASARIDREFFCTIVAVAMVAGAINVALTDVWPRWRLGAAILTGGLGAWFWMTREEGIWLMPTLMLIAILGWRLAGFSARSLVGPGIALMVGLSLIGSIGLVNRLVYGRFVVNEINSGPFQSALVELEKASYADWTAYVPVPLAARQKIYAESATFAQLKPYLDPPNARTSWRGAGCDMLPTSCDEIAGGWFLWALRDAAAQLGVMSNPRSAATFFAAIENEVSSACREGRLQCARWLLPLVPPFTWDQVRKFPRQLRASISIAVLADPPDPAYWPLDPLSGLELQGLELLAVPEHGPGRIVVVRGHADLSGVDSIFWRSGSTQIVHLVWNGMASTTNESKPQRRTFSLTLACLSEPCALGVGKSADTAVNLPIQDLRAQPVTIDGAGSIVFDSVDATPLTLRSRASAAFADAIPMLGGAYHVLILLGCLCFIASLIANIIRKTAPPLFLIAVSFVIAVVVRSFLIALVDATSFPAIDLPYMLPLLPFSVAAAFLSLTDCFIAATVWAKWYKSR